MTCHPFLHDANALVQGVIFWGSPWCMHPVSRVLGHRRVAPTAFYSQSGEAGLTCSLQPRVRHSLGRNEELPPAPWEVMEIHRPEPKRLLGYLRP